MKFLFAFLLSLALTGAQASAAVVERILAVVNDEIVAEQDLEMAMAPVLAQYRTHYTGQEFEDKVKEARAEFLQKVIDDKLILSEAKRKQVIVSDAEVDEMMADVRNKFATRDEFLKAITEQGMTEKKLWDRFRDQLMTQKLVNYEVRSKVSVSPGEVSEYYKANQDKFVQGDRMQLQQILVRFSSHSEEEARQIADSVHEKLKAGQPFDELAKTRSEGSEAQQGGQMGWIEKGQLLGEIEDKVFVLQPGQFTGPVKSSLGYHIFKVTDRQQFSVKPLADVRAQVTDAIFKEKLRVRLEAWMESLKKNAYISIR